MRRWRGRWIPGDLLTAHIGAGLAGKVSNKVGQGAFTALRTPVSA
jgi:hypothetical protein